jgi:hypothetical protein
MHAPPSKVRTARLALHAVDAHDVVFKDIRRRQKCVLEPGICRRVAWSSAIVPLARHGGGIAGICGQQRMPADVFAGAHTAAGCA